MKTPGHNKADKYVAVPGSVASTLQDFGGKRAFIFPVRTNRVLNIAFGLC